MSALPTFFSDAPWRAGPAGAVDLFAEHARATDTRVPLLRLALGSNGQRHDVRMLWTADAGAFAWFLNRTGVALPCGDLVVPDCRPTTTAVKRQLHLSSGRALNLPVGGLRSVHATRFPASREDVAALVARHPGLAAAASLAAVTGRPVPWTMPHAFGGSR